MAVDEFIFHNIRIDNIVLLFDEVASNFFEREGPVSDVQDESFSDVQSECLVSELHPGAPKGMKSADVCCAHCDSTVEVLQTSKLVSSCHCAIPLM